MSHSIIFLDFDGVIRVSDGGIGMGDGFDFCQSRMKMLATVASQCGARIVVSSDWRNFGNRQEIEILLSPYLDDLLHEDWMTPICGPRWNEVAKWLGSHPDVTNYAILDDFIQHFEGCPEGMRSRLLLCTNRYGLVPEISMRIPALLVS
jgi:hypothetical protein